MRLLTMPPEGQLSLSDARSTGTDFLREVYRLIGAGCGHVEALRLGEGLVLLVADGLSQEPPNYHLQAMLLAMDALPAKVQGAGVFCGTADGELAGLSPAQVARVRAAHDVATLGTSPITGLPLA